MHPCVLSRLRHLVSVASLVRCFRAQHRFLSSPPFLSLPVTIWPLLRPASVGASTSSSLLREVGGLRNRNLAAIARLVSTHAQASKTGISVVPLASVWLARISLGHPVRRVPCARRDFAALLFRFLPQEILSPKKPNPRDKISRCCLPKKRRLPLGAGRLRSLRAWVSRVRFGQFRFGG